MREAREARKRADGERDGLLKERDEALAKVREVERLKDNVLLDPIGHYEAQGYSKDDLATLAETIMYHLAPPEKVPVEHRVRLVEAQRKRDEIVRERKAEEERTKAAQTAELERVKTYAGALDEAVRSGGIDTSTVPVSAAWFADDHATYVESLFHTARNLAESAHAAGKVADLSPQNVAKVLEEHLAQRAGRLPRAKAPAEGVTPPQEPKDTKQSPDSKTQPQAPQSDRLRRAAAVVFGS